MMFFITAEEQRLIQLVREEQARLRPGQPITLVLTIDENHMSLGTVAPKGKIAKAITRQNGHKK